LDPPQQVVRVSPIRRRWAAEEFSGELDDRINPLWLLEGNASISIHHDGEAESRPAARLTLSENPIAAARDSSRSSVFVRAIKQFDEPQPVPLIIESSAESDIGAGDEDWDL
jgi:hypothetical protein